MVELVPYEEDEEPETDEDNENDKQTATSRGVLPFVTTSLARLGR